MNVRELLEEIQALVSAGTITPDTMVVVNGYEGDLDDPVVTATICAPDKGMGAGPGGPSYFGKHEETPMSGHDTVPCLLIGRY